nr:unnamed protein product [Spirometra erinaceieuropaei]
MAEHAAGVRRNDAKFQVAVHSTRSGYTFIFNEAELLERGENRVSRELLESWFTSPQSINKCNDLSLPYWVLGLRLGGVFSHAGSAQLNTTSKASVENITVNPAATCPMTTISATILVTYGQAPDAPPPLPITTSIAIATSPMTTTTTHSSTLNAGENIPKHCQPPLSLLSSS